MVYEGEGTLVVQAYTVVLQPGVTFHDRIPADSAAWIKGFRRRAKVRQVPTRSPSSPQVAITRSRHLRTIGAESRRPSPSGSITPDVAAKRLQLDSEVLGMVAQQFDLVDQPSENLPDVVVSFIGGDAFHETLCCA